MGVELVKTNGLLLITLLTNYYSSLANGFWLIPDYWTSVYRSGHIEPGRTSEQFISFPNSTHNYIGYWISSSAEQGKYHEAYGNVFPELWDDNGVRFCGLFADIYENKSRKVCGGFRVLSRKANIPLEINPFEFVPVSTTILEPEKAVEYLDWQIARYRADQSASWIYGGAKVLQRIAYFPQNGTEQLIKLDYRDNEQLFLSSVQILQRSQSFDPRDLQAHVQPAQPQPPQQPQPEPPQTPATTTRPSTTTSSTTTTPTTTAPQPPVDVENIKKAPPVYEDYDSLPGAGVEWGAVEGSDDGGVLSIDDNELILPQ